MAGKEGCGSTVEQMRAFFFALLDRSSMSRKTIFTSPTMTQMSEEIYTKILCFPLRQ